MERRHARISAVEALLLVLTVSSLTLLPWLVAYWPAEEEPRRLAIAHTWLQESWVAHMDPYSVILLASGRLIGLVDAGRLMCSLAIASLCLAECFLLRRVAPERWTSVYLLLPLSTGPLLLRGGTPLMLGLSLGITATALVTPRLIGRPVDATVLDRRAAGAALLLALAGLTSPLSLFLCAAALLLLAGPRLLRPPGWLLIVLIALAAIPGLLHALDEVRAASAGPGWMNPRLDERVRGITGGDLSTFSSWEGVVRRIAVVWLLAGGAAASWRAGLRGCERGPSLARLFLGALFLALLMPAVADLPACSEMAADQLLWIACALAVTLPRRLRPATAGSGLLLVAGLTLVQSHAMREPVDRIQAVVEAGRSIPRGSRVLPLRFGAPAPAAIDPLRHAWGYVALERDIVTPHMVGGRGAILSCASPLPWSAARPDEGGPLPHLGEDAASRIEAMNPRVCFGVTEPALDCTCQPWRQIRYRALLETALAYDRVLVVSAPEEFLTMAKGSLELLTGTGDVQVFRPRIDPDDRAGLVCEPVSPPSSGD